MKNTAQYLLCSAILLGCFWGFARADEPSNRVISLDIPAQPLGEALAEFGKQSDLTMVFYDQDVGKGLRAKRLLGSFTTDDALGRLLSNTGLRYEYLDARTIAILSERAAGAALSQDGVKAWPSGPANELKLAKSAQETEGAPDGAGRSEGSSGVSDRSRDVQEIVVTAQKREERLQDVPISMTVVRGADLDRSTDQGVHEALSRIPGVTIDVVGGTGAVAGGTSVAVRGVTAPSSYIAGSSPVGYYVDTVPFGLVRSAVVPDVNAYDLERVEALRGPQGTLYGANAQAGVVRILTKDANLEKFEFKARTSGSSTEDGDISYRGDVAANVPIIEGKLAARAVVSYQDLGGWIDKPTRADANDGRMRNTRLKLNAQPTEQLSIGLSAWVSRSESGALPIGNAADGLQNTTADVESKTEDFETYGLKVGYDFSAFTLTSATSYLDYESVNNIGAFSAGGITRSFARTALPATTFSEEINLASTHEGPWRWTLGGIYRDGTDRIRGDFAIFPSPGSLKYSSESWAAFGELTRAFYDGRLELTAGLRHFEDDMTLKEELTAGFAQPPQYVHANSKFDATTPRLILNWHPSQQMTAYASYAEGFRSGVHQTPAVIRAVPSLRPAQPDSLKNYELGTKGVVWNGRVNYDAAVYYMDWQDVQLPLVLFIDGLGRGALVNGAAASGMGADFSLTASPMNALMLGLNFSWNDLTLDQDVFTAGPGGIPVQLFNKGDRLNQSAETTAGAFVDYAFPLGARFEGRLSASANLTSKRTEKTASGATVLVNQGDAITIGNVSFSIDSPNHWTTMLFVDNINNEQGVAYRSVNPATGIVTATYPRPRTIGVQLEYRFE